MDAGTASDVDAGVADVVADVEADVAPQPQYECVVDGVPVEVTAEHYGIDQDGQIVAADCPELGFTVFTGINGPVLGLGRVDGGYVLAGVTGGAKDCVSETGEVYWSYDDVVLVWLDEAANVIAARRYGHQQDEELTAMAVASDGTVLFATSASSDGPSLVKKGAVLTRVSPSGDVEWRSRWPFKGMEGLGATVHSIEALPGTAPAQFAIGGRVFDEDSQTQGFVARMDSLSVEETFTVYDASTILTGLAPGPAGKLGFAASVSSPDMLGSIAGVLNNGGDLDWLSPLPDGRDAEKIRHVLDSVVDPASPSPCPQLRNRALQTRAARFPLGRRGDGGAEGAGSVVMRESQNRPHTWLEPHLRSAP